MFSNSLLFFSVFTDPETANTFFPIYLTSFNPFSLSITLSLGSTYVKAPKLYGSSYANITSHSLLISFKI